MKVFSVIAIISAVAAKLAHVESTEAMESFVCTKARIQLDMCIARNQDIDLSACADLFEMVDRACRNETA